MTRYEAYLTLFYALSALSQKHPDNESLTSFVERMDPFSFYGEGSRDPEIYDRFSDKWVTIGSTVTSNSQNGGLTFAKAFLDTLPKEKGRYDGLKTVFLSLGQEDWEEALRMQAYSGTYELMHDLMRKKYAVDPIEGMDEYLYLMNPFGELFSSDGSIWNRFCACADGMSFEGVEYRTAEEFALSEDRKVYRLFSRISEEEWDDVRFNRPYSFRMCE